MGIAVNLVTYMIAIMHMPSSTAANTVTDFMGTSFLLCLLGGFLADSFLGRYKTIGIFASIQTLGTVTLAISTKLPQLRPPPCHANSDSCKQANGFQMGILYLSLYLIALGTGGLKSSVSGFGSDQFDEKDEKEKSQMTYFFNRFFFFISFGTLAAVTVLVYIQDEVSRSLAYGICSDIPEASRIEHTDQFRFFDKAAIVAEDDFETNLSGSAPNPWKLCSLTRVEEVKMMVRLLPVWATTILFWTIYAQLITFSVEQASTMERNIGSFQIPAGSLTVFFVAAILITLAFNDRVIMPLWKKWKGKPGFTNLQRIAIGLVFSVFGMAIASLCERKRLSVAKGCYFAAVASPHRYDCADVASLRRLLLHHCVSAVLRLGHNFNSAAIVTPRYCDSASTTLAPRCDFASAAHASCSVYPFTAHTS
ncbi:hypothetical protein VNO78_23527 [Psophocarpus tetragonolobus]|uniref:Uncharacterized protein n=1 Tax=Psophocarpus tetragonolobus TaxID=3891 RepID=A0AAN9S4M6_PSOTE